MIDSVWPKTHGVLFDSLVLLASMLGVLTWRVRTEDHGQATVAATRTAAAAVASN